ncbi:hypothetical protein [Nesterenkonia rhizosphaerae]|uniref:DUF4238 domain-containing protein n=1 Tax=Nesterenkonia rhizosphaerae TaxID=1348272 RepID=A0ABP9FZF7_9MICC
MVTKQQRISDVFGLHGELPFLNVPAHTDGRMFVDPAAIRLHPDPEPFKTIALACMDTFVDQVTKHVLHRSRNSKQEGLDLLRRFTEPSETHLGMTRRGVKGHGGSDDVARWIWDALTQDGDALVSFAIFKQIEDLPLFVEGIAEDITSDITTRLIFSALVDFTHKMTQQYHQIPANAPLTKESKVLWDHEAEAWTERTIELPTLDGRQLVLVPTHWARPNLLVSRERYYQVAVLDFIQETTATITLEGRVLKTSKKSLKESGNYPRDCGNLVRMTVKALREDIDLMRQFKDFVKAKYAPVDPDRIEQRLAA